MNRTHEDIIYEILTQIIIKPRNQTQIMYLASMSYTQTLVKVAFIVEHGLVTRGEDKNKNKKYYITEKGRAFVEQLNEIRGIYNPLARH